MKNRTTANAINGDSVNEVRLSASLPGTYGSRKETESVLLNAGVPEPTNVGANAAGLGQWQKSYGDFWELKIAFDKEHDR
jgi:hypothetical protein